MEILNDLGVQKNELGLFWKCYLQNAYKSYN